MNLLQRHSLTALASIFVALIATYCSQVLATTTNSTAKLEPKPVVAIIIDDLGYDLDKGRAFAGITGDITLSIIPFTPYSHQLATLFGNAGKEIMLHAPMAPIDSGQSWEKGLYPTMSADEMKVLVNRMVADIPGLRGVNNHGGSLLTQDPERMNWLMQTLAEHQLYFVDSRTTALTQAFQSAADAGLPSTSRNIFLDNEVTYDAITEQLTKLTKLAKVKGQALAIGHPHPETLAALADYMQVFEDAGISLLPVSEYLRVTR